MEVIDKKGRVFGKINIIDFFALLFLFSILTLGSFASLNLHKDNGKAEVVIVDIGLNVKFLGLNQATINLISIGDRQLDDDGRVIAEIVWIGKPIPQTYGVDVDEADRITVKDKLLNELPVKLKLTANLEGNRLYFDKQMITINSDFYFKCNKYKVRVSPLCSKEEKWIRIMQ